MDVRNDKKTKEFIVKNTTKEWRESFLKEMDELDKKKELIALKKQKCGGF